jgi:uncharacterized membrane protein
MNKPKPKSLAKSLRANLLSGIFLSAPIVATYLVIKFLFDLTTGWINTEGVRRFLAENKLMNQLLADTWLENKVFLIRVIALLLVLGLLIAVGYLTRNFVGRQLYRLSDKVLETIPIVRNVYITVRQLSESLFSQRKTMFKEVVLVEYPRRGLYSLAFVTSQVPKGIRHSITNKMDNEECLSLFVPTTPNPTSGILLLVPRSEVTTLDMEVTDALTYVMSGGAVRPDSPGDTRPSLLDKLESWITGDDTILELPDGDKDTR